MKQAKILIGLPASGKTTYITQLMKESLSRRELFTAVVLSTDDFIEGYARREGKTYDDVFRDYVDSATKAFWSGMEQMAAVGHDIIVDRTNLTRKSRARIIAILKKHQYEIEAVILPTPDPQEWERRLHSRPGKTIPPHVISSMQESYQHPTFEEGFRTIVTV